MLTMSDDKANLLLQEDCLKDRKWWCFLLSSIFTFLAGIFIVLIWRAFSFLCCRNRDPSEYQKQQEKDKLLAQQGQGQPPGQPKPKNLMEGNFVTEAKDWAGELISGQTTTGRILVSGLLLSPRVLRVCILSLGAMPSCRVFFSFPSYSSTAFSCSFSSSCYFFTLLAQTSDSGMWFWLS